MTDDELCGAPTSKGGTCQNLEESCPWHDEDGERTDKAPGRKSKLPEVKDDMLQAAREGVTLAGVARAGGVPEQTLHRWINENDEFREELKAARSEAERDLVKEVVEGENRDPRFILGTSFGYNKKQEVDLDANVEHGGQVDVVARLQQAYEQLEEETDVN